LADEITWITWNYLQNLEIISYPNSYHDLQLRAKCRKIDPATGVRNINICGRILTQFTGLLRTNTVAAKRNLLAERTGLGKSVSVSLRKNGPYRFTSNEHRSCET
jgi:hypothetical protein